MSHYSEAHFYHKLKYRYISQSFLYAVTSNVSPQQPDDSTDAYQLREKITRRMNQVSGRI